MWTTATDLAKVGVELLQILRGKSSEIWSKETIEEMLHSQETIQTQATPGVFGLGWMIGGNSDRFQFFHSGWNEGFVSTMRVYADGKGAIVILNSNEGYPMIEEIIRSIATEYEWSDPLLKEKTTVSLSNIHNYTGIYTSEAGIKFQVSVVNDCLMLQHGQQKPFPIFPSSEIEFFTTLINAEICFEKNNKADVISMTFSQEGNQIKANKQFT